MQFVLQIPWEKICLIYNKIEPNEQNISPTQTERSLFTSCVTVGKLFNPAVLWFSYCKGELRIHLHYRTIVRIKWVLGTKQCLVSSYALPFIFSIEACQWAPETLSLSPSLTHPLPHQSCQMNNYLSLIFHTFNKLINTCLYHTGVCYTPLHLLFWCSLTRLIWKWICSI